MVNSFWKIILGLVLLAGVSCSKEKDMVETISLFSATLNSASLTSGLQGVSTNAEIVLVFSKGVNPTSFQAAFELVPQPQAISFAYSNQSSRVTINLDLEFSTSYNLKISQNGIGTNRESLENELQYTFTTLDDGTIYRLPPCTEASNDCLQSMYYGSTPGGELPFYASYPIFEENAEWLDLTSAIIVVHGANRDADNYFNFLSTTLQQENLADSVVLIAPNFKNAAEANENEFYWTNTGWRSGNNSLDANAISSFELVDAIIDQLADKSHFPVLEKIVITGHSSGGLFTHVYGAANKAANRHTDLQFEYVSANSQYFYYPGDERINESSNELYIPSGCTGYNFYPLGYNVVNDYVAGILESDFNDQFVHRSITYLLGNGNTPDPALNTSDCAATLLGSSRYQRGENMFQYMELKYPSEHNHKRVLVQGIGHDGRAMYQSSEFRTFIQQLLN